MKKSITVSPPNSLVLVSDRDGGDIPLSMGDAAIVATSSCIAIGCRQELDGKTQITMGPGVEANPELTESFRRTIPTPSKILVVRTVTGETLLDVTVEQFSTAVRIWTNHCTEPDKIAIGYD